MDDELFEDLDDDWEYEDFDYSNCCCDLCVDNYSDEVDGNEVAD